jgi:hypothetical protein
MDVCVLHDLGRAAPTPPSRAVLFGLSLCDEHIPQVAAALTDGASVRDIIEEAMRGEWL